MRIDYIKANPTENKTILVKTPVSRMLQSELARRLMDIDDDVEQVGFLEKPSFGESDIRLQMMGGEFCGNASISAAAYEARKKGILNGEKRKIFLESSGADKILECEISIDNGIFFGKMEMPIPENIIEMKLEIDGCICSLTGIFLPGITHMVIENTEIPDNYTKFAEKAIKQWSSQIVSEAVGLILFDESNCEIRPLVYVKSTDSLFWERGCGSGTAAVGAYYSYKTGRNIKLEVKQPGGIISTETEYENGIVKRLSITGGVFFEREGSFEINIDAI